jgi:hypothetical protein
VYFQTAIAHTNPLTLDETIARLAAHPAVDGILLMGTTGTDDLTPTSDYDLLLVFDDARVPLQMVNTWVEWRLTEIYCTTVAGLERVVESAAAWPDGSIEGAMVRWLRGGRTVHDSSGRLARAQAITQAVTDQPLPAEREIYGAWAAIGYDLAQTKRYLASNDPIAQEAVDWRLIYGLGQVLSHYFTVRRIPWRGEKPAIHFLAANDPDFLGLLRRCLAATDRRRKFALYEELARAALAPVGGLWETGTTVVRPGPGLGVASDADGPLAIEEALAFWRELIGE